MVLIDPAAVAAAPRQTLGLVGFRNQAPGYDPRSGEGTRRHGGRFNPPQSFAAVYLCSTRACAVAELTRQAARQGLRPDDLLPRELWKLEAELASLLDLTAAATLAHLGISPDDVVGDDLRLTRLLGEAAHDHGVQAIRSASATGVDTVIAVFPENLGGARLVPQLIETWETAADIGI